jgi:hypothetical protein
MNSEEARKITADLILGKKPPTLATVAVATVYASSGVNTDEAKAVARKLGDIGGALAQPARLERYRKFATLLHVTTVLITNVLATGYSESATKKVADGVREVLFDNGIGLVYDMADSGRMEFTASVIAQHCRNLVSGFGGGVLQAAPVHFAVAQAVAADTYITALVQTALEVVMDL